MTLVTLAVLLLSMLAPVSVADDAPRATLSWKSKKDEGLYGYLIYRADKREGPYRRVNRDVIHVVGADATGISSYTWVDTDVEPGRTYFYYLDTLGTDGRKRRFSGVVSKSVAAD